MSCVRTTTSSGHYVPLLRRIIILVAVITAVPVVLWTITAFVRTYVGPPRIPTFHQLAATEPIDASANSSPDADRRRPNRRRAGQAFRSRRRNARGKGGRMVDARDVSVAPKGPLLADRSPDSDAACPRALPASAAKMTDASPSTSPSPKTPDMVAGSAARHRTACSTCYPVPATPQRHPASNHRQRWRAQRPSAASEPPADDHAGRSAAVRPDSAPAASPAHYAPKPPMTQHGADGAGECTDAAAAAGHRRSGTARRKRAPGPLDFLQNILH